MNAETNLRVGLVRSRFMRYKGIAKARDRQLRSFFRPLEEFFQIELLLKMRSELVALSGSCDCFRLLVLMKEKIV